MRKGVILNNPRLSRSPEEYAQRASPKESNARHQVHSSIQSRNAAGRLLLLEVGVNDFIVVQTGRMVGGSGSRRESILDTDMKAKTDAFWNIRELLEGASAREELLPLLPAKWGDNREHLMPLCRIEQNALEFRTDYKREETCRM